MHYIKVKAEKIMLRSLVSVIATILLATGARAQTISLGHVSGGAGQAVSLPVTLDAPVDCSALLLRLDYDPDVLDFSATTPGPILADNHTVDVHEPEAGRDNLLVIGTDKPTVFTAQSGVLVTLDFTIQSDAPLGPTPIGLATSGLPDLPASGLLGAAGDALAHTVANGSVTVAIDPQTATRPNWLLYE